MVPEIDANVFSSGTAARRKAIMALAAGSSARYQAEARQRSDWRMFTSGLYDVNTAYAAPHNDNEDDCAELSTLTEALSSQPSNKPDVAEFSGQPCGTATVRSMQTGYSSHGCMRRAVQTTAILNQCDGEFVVGMPGINLHALSMGQCAPKMVQMEL